MKIIVGAFVLALQIILTFSAADAEARGGGRSSGGSNYRSGYFKPSTGTYVRPSMATNPNRTQFDNYSTKGNVNPYSGQPGTRLPRH